MKVFSLKMDKFLGEDWEDEFGNFMLCVDETRSLFRLKSAYKKLSVRVSRRRQILKDGWVRLTRTDDWWVRRVGYSQNIEIYSAAAEKLEKMGISVGDDFWVKVERG